MRRFAIMILAALAAASLHAQEWPSKPVRIVVPYAAGGTSDVLARLMGQRLSEAWGQPVVVENRAGANGNVGSDVVAKSPADGYTLLLGTSGSNAVNPSLYKTMPYDAKRDLVYAAPIASTANVLLVNPASPHQNLKSLLDAARANPGKVSYGSSGVGSVLHLCGVMVTQKTGIQWTHIAYKGTGPSLTDLMGGQIDLIVSNFPESLPHVKGGKLRAVAVTGDKRSNAMPDVPTLAEQGFPGFSALAWWGVFAPAGTPKPIVDKLNAELAKAINLPDVKKHLAEQLGMDLVVSSPDALQTWTVGEIARWGKVVKENGIRAD